MLCDMRMSDDAKRVEEQLAIADNAIIYVRLSNVIVDNVIMYVRLSQMIVDNVKMNVWLSKVTVENVMT